MSSRPFAFAVALLVLFAIALRLAWLGDDAYITLRSVENWCSGLGLRWNPGDRVQTYTHPLWMLVLAAGRAVSGEVYTTTIVVSLVLSFAAIARLLGAATTVAALLTTAWLLAGSRAFVEYTTSGLETPLTYLLLVLFVDAIVRADVAPRARFAQAVLLTALLATNRMDLGLLCAPAVLATLRGNRLGAVLTTGALASLPFAAWLLFAGLYYGSPFPVTAHAKAFGVGIPAGDLAQQGLHYAAFAWRDDPLLVATVVLGTAVALLQRPTRWLGLGALLYVGYVVKVGGDFMAGRFFLPPFVVAIAVLVRWLGQRSTRTVVLLALAAFGLVAARGVPAWLQSTSADVPATDAEIEAQHGIVDERRMHYRTLGLFADGRLPPTPGTMEALAFPQGRTQRWFLLNGSVGTAGFQMGPRGWLVDPLLCDPLLTRLPAKNPTRWRIGHVLRRVPEGYWESLASGENRIRHPGLRDYYGALRTLTQAPVFDGERLAVLARMATGAFDEGFRAYVATDYRQPPRVGLARSELGSGEPLGTFWFDTKRPCLVCDGGVSIGLDGQTHTAKELQLVAFGALFFSYRVRFLNDGPVVGDAMAVPVLPDPLTAAVQLGGACAFRVAVPDGIAFDTVWIDVVETPTTHLMTGPPGIVGLELK